MAAKFKQEEKKFSQVAIQTTALTKKHIEPGYWQDRDAIKTQKKFRKVPVHKRSA
jgi:hypothetical protein